MMKLNFGYILTRAWQIIWKYKILWVFGIFAGFAENGGGNFNNSNNDSNFNSNGNAPAFTNRQLGQYLEALEEFFQKYLLIIIAVCLALLIISLLLNALGMMGRIGIIKGVAKVENGAEVLAFGEIWSESMPYLWRIFGLNFLIGLVFFIIIVLPLLVIILLAFSNPAIGLGIACIIPLICILVPVSLVVRIILEQVQPAIVIENLSMAEGLKRGWAIVKSDIGGIIVMALILGAGSFIIGLVLAIPFILALLPIFFSLFAFPQFETLASIPPIFWVSIACCTLYLPIAIFLSGILTAYKKTAWALAYLQLAKPTPLTENNVVIVSE